MATNYSLEIAHIAETAMYDAPPAERSHTMPELQVSFTKWFLASLSTYAVADAILVRLAGAALGIAEEHLIILFALLMVAGAVASAMVFWARKVRNQSMTWAFRFGVSLFAFFVLFMSALLFSAVQNGFVPRGDLAFWFSSPVLPGSAIGAFSVYLMARRRVAKENY